MNRSKTYDEALLPGELKFYLNELLITLQRQNLVTPCLTLKQFHSRQQAFIKWQGELDNMINLSRWSPAEIPCLLSFQPIHKNVCLISRWQRQNEGDKSSLDCLAEIRVHLEWHLLCSKEWVEKGCCISNKWEPHFDQLGAFLSFDNDTAIANCLQHFGCNLHHPQFCIPQNFLQLLTV